jgi:hypothetical protein
MTGTRVDSIPTAFLERMNETPPVPSTAMFSRTDGVASWWCCVDEARPDAENIEVPGSHIGLLHNPAALYIVADRLAQPTGTHEPFKPPAWLRSIARPGPWRRPRGGADAGGTVTR